MELFDTHFVLFGQVLAVSAIKNVSDNEFFVSQYV